MKRLLVGTFLFLFVLAGRSSAAPAKAKPITVPFELIKSKHIAIKIMINGKGPYRVIFDTGAPITLLNNKTAKASGVVGKNYKPSPFALFGAAGEFKIKTLQVGDLKAANVPVIVMDHPTVSLISKVLGPIEGLVGFPFFAQFEMTIDYQAKTLTFVPSGYKPGNVMRQMEKMIGLLGNQKPKPKVLAPAAQWGFRVEKDAKDEDAGVEVKEVLAGSAAAAAGMKAGDRLLTLDGRWTDSVAECYSAAGKVKAGTAAKVVVKRKGKEVELTVKPVAGL
jgi:hypothetical protein